MAERSKAVILVTSTFVHKRSKPDFDKSFFFFFFFFLNVKIGGCGLYGAAALSPANTVVHFNFFLLCCKLKQLFIMVWDINNLFRLDRK